jgi:hypothetical protein
LLEYPYTIRSDAITAVGAPSTVGYLMRALYWLYLGARMFYFNPSWYQILEDSADDFSEKDEHVIPVENVVHVEAEQSLFQ